MLLFVRLLDSGNHWGLLRCFHINDNLGLEGKGIPEEDLLPSTRPLMIVAVVVGTPRALAGGSANSPVGKAFTVEFQALRFFARAGEELNPLLKLRLVRFCEDLALPFPPLTNLQVFC